MNQKIVGIIPLIAAMMFVAVFAVGDNPAAAASTATQTATVTVNQNIALSVDTQDLTYSGNDGAYATSDEYTLSNDGNVKINVYAKLENENFAGSDPIATSGSNIFQIENDASAWTDIHTATSGAGTILTSAKLDTAKHGSNTLGTMQRLMIPTGTEAGSYTNTITYTAVA